MPPFRMIVSELRVDSEPDQRQISLLHQTHVLWEGQEWPTLEEAESVRARVDRMQGLLRSDRPSALTLFVEERVVRPELIKLALGGQKWYPNENWIHRWTVPVELPACQLRYWWLGRTARRGNR